MKAEEIIEGNLYTTEDGLIIEAVRRIKLSENSFSGKVIANSPSYPNDYKVGSIYNHWCLKAFSPLSESTEILELRSIQKNEVKEERLESASREIGKLFNNKYITS